MTRRIDVANCGLSELGGQNQRASRLLDAQVHTLPELKFVPQPLGKHQAPGAIDRDTKYHISMVRAIVPRRHRELRVILAVSARSQAPAEARQTTVLAAKPSAEQSLATPSHASETSQVPAGERQTALLLASAGQLGLAPSHTASIA